MRLPSFLVVGLLFAAPNDFANEVEIPLRAWTTEASQSLNSLLDFI